MVLPEPTSPCSRRRIGLRRAHVGDNLAQRALLRGGGMEGQHLADRLAHLVGGRKGDAGAFAHAAALEFQAQLEKEQLFKDQAAVRRRGRTLAAA